MKKMTLLVSALLIAGATFAHEGKGCCKGKKEGCSKEKKEAWDKLMLQMDSMQLSAQEKELIK